MTLTELHGLLGSALDGYVAGGAGWATQSGVQKAPHYAALEDFTTDGVCVYAWIGAGEAQEEADSPMTSEMEAIVYARGKAVGDQALLALRSAMLTDDLQRMLLSMNGGSACTVSVHSFEEPVVTGNSANVLVRAVCRYAGSAA